MTASGCGGNEREQELLKRYGTEVQNAGDGHIFKLAVDKVIGRPHQRERANNGLSSLIVEDGFMRAPNAAKNTVQPP